MGCVIKYKGQSILEEQFLQYLNKQIAINNLFETNGDFASKIYEALGFTGAISLESNLKNTGKTEQELIKYLQEKYPEIKLNITNNPIWEQGSNVFNQEEYENQINYRLKAIEILLSDKAKQVFEKGKKNNWSLDKILTELAVPKAQKQLILDLGITDREQIALELSSNYSYTVEINTAKKSFLMDGINENTRISTNTQYYSNLTVSGGTNYTENEISTPLITPSIKGHAQFATDKGIGWFRSDDKLDNIKYELATSKHNTDEHRFSYGEFIKNKNSVRVTRNVEGDYSIHEGDLSDLSKSERIKLFEKQSSVIPVGGKIVQRGASSFDGIRHRINLKNHGFSIEYGTNNLQEYKSTDKNAVQEFSNAYNLGSVIEKDGKLFTKGVILTKNIDIKSSTKTRRILEVQSDLFQKGRDKEQLVNINRRRLQLEKEGYSVNDAYDIAEKEFKENSKENQFLQLLNKDNNWVTFFIKSIIQSTVKETVTEIQEFNIEDEIRNLEKEGTLKIKCD